MMLSEKVKAKSYLIAKLKEKFKLPLKREEGMEEGGEERKR